MTGAVVSVVVVVVVEPLPLEVSVVAETAELCEDMFPAAS